MSVNFTQKPKKRIHHYFIPSEHNDHKPHFIRHKALHAYSALLIGLKVVVVVLSFLAYPNPAEFSTITSSRILELTNLERQEEGLPILTRNKDLDRSATMKAQDMIENDYFAHNSPDGVSPWKWFKDVDYIYTFAGENLAMNFSEAEDAMVAWMASPTHRANILNSNYSEMGVGVAVGEINGEQTTVVVQHFGKSYLSSLPSTFTKEDIESIPSVSGTTQAAGESVEVRLFGENKPSLKETLIYYSEKFFLAMFMFILINLILTIIIRIRVQHKPIIVHSVAVIGIALLTLLVKFHFFEYVVGGTIKIM